MIIDIKYSKPHINIWAHHTCKYINSSPYSYKPALMADYQNLKAIQINFMLIILSIRITRWFVIGKYTFLLLCSCKRQSKINILHFRGKNKPKLLLCCSQISIHIKKYIFFDSNNHLIPLHTFLFIGYKLFLILKQIVFWRFPFWFTFNERFFLSRVVANEISFFNIYLLIISQRVFTLKLMDTVVIFFTNNANVGSISSVCYKIIISRFW